MAQVKEGAMYLREYGVLPDAGGWRQQDALLMRDILVYIRLRASREHLYRKRDKQSNEEPWFVSEAAVRID